MLWFVSPYAQSEKKEEIAPAAPVQQVASVEPHQPLNKLLIPPEGRASPPNLPYFTYAARVVTPAVVHIKVQNLKSFSDLPIKGVVPVLFIPLMDTLLPVIGELRELIK